MPTDKDMPVAPKAEVIDITKNKDQPKPKFTLLDLEDKLGIAYDAIKRQPQQVDVDIARAILQELLARVSQIKNDLDTIEMPIENAKAVTDILDTEKPELVVCGAQLYEYGKIQGVSLYTTIVKARRIRDICNQRFAELKVDHVVRIVNYPVY